MEYELKEKDELHENPENEENFESLSSIVQDAIIQVNEHGLIIYWNKSAENFFGLSKMDALDKNLHQLIAPKRYLKAAKEAFTKFKNSGQGVAIGKTLELEGKKKNGEDFPIELSLSSFQVNGEWNAVGIIKDITKRRKAENKIKERLKELTCLYKLSKLAAKKTLDSDSFLKEAINLIPPAWQFSEFCCTKITVKGKEYKTDNYKVTKWRQSSEIYIENQKIGEIEVGYLEETPIFDEGPFLKEERNLINGISEILSGVLELKLTEETLKESEEKFRTAVKNSPDYILFIKRDGTIFEVNRLEKGFTREMVIGQNVFNELFYETGDQIVSVRKAIGDSLKTGETTLYESSQRAPDGSITIYETRVSPFEYDNEDNIISFQMASRDITDKKKAEQKLKESEVWLSTTLNSIGDAVIATDNKGHISFLNPVSESLTGWKHGEAIGKPIEDVFNIVNEKTRKRVESPVLRVLREGVIVGLANHTILIAKNGKEIPIADSAAPLKDDKGDIIDVVLVFRNITEQRRAEHIIEERVKELNCLYSISKIVEEEFIEIEELLSQSVEFLPPAWQFPEVTCARIVVDGQEYKTDNFKEMKWKQASDIIIEKEKIGTVEIYYLEEMPEFNEGPFLKEERHLIDNIAAVLGIYLEHKKKEEEIRLQSEIIENMSEGVYLIKINDGTIVYNNPAFEEMFGYNPGEMIGKDFAIVNATIDKNPEETRDKIMEIINETGEWNGEVLNIKKDETPFWCYANVSLFDHPEYGRVIFSVHTDITELKLTEEKLKQSEAKHRNIINNLDAAVYQVLLDGKLLNHNPAYNLIFGYDAIQDLKNTNVNLLWVNPDLRQLYLEQLLRDGYVKNYICHVLKKDGTKIVLQLNSHVIKDKEGKPVRIDGTFINVTEKFVLEQKLIESEEKYRIIFENANDAISILDLEGNFYKVNKLYCTRLGYTREEIMKFNVRDLEIPEYADLISGRLLDAKEKGFNIIETAHRAKDGRIIPVEISCKSILYDKKPAILTIARDITERKKSERLKEKFREQLEREVKNRTKNLKELLEKQRLYLEQIEKSSRFKTEFLATMSHELRTPLNAIIGFTDLLIEGVFGELNKEQNEYIRDIDDSSKHLLDMITHILDISKIESGQVKLKIEEIQLNNIIDQVISTLKPLYTEKDIKWELVGLKKERFIFADRIKFKQIIYNLLSNAIKFTKKGKIKFEFKENKKDWEFIVKDTGIGISELNYHIIFKDFKRVKSDYVNATQGTGLGLALTKRLINVQGGDIFFNSKVGEGTTFTFNLPKTLKEKLSNVNRVESFLNKL